MNNSRIPFNCPTGKKTILFVVKSDVLIPGKRRLYIPFEGYGQHSIGNDLSQLRRLYIPFEGYGQLYGRYERVGGSRNTISLNNSIFYNNIFIMEKLLHTFSLEMLVAISVLLLQQIFQKFILPYIESLIKSVSTISGEWEGYDPETNIHDSDLLIKQFGTRITAKGRRINSKRTFTYRGYIRADQVVLNWKENKAEGHNIGSMVLKLSANSQTLIGISVYKNNDTNDIISQKRGYRKR